MHRYTHTHRDIYRSQRDISLNRWCNRMRKKMHRTIIMIVAICWSNCLAEKSMSGLNFKGKRVVRRGLLFKSDFDEFSLSQERW